MSVLSQSPKTLLNVSFAPSIQSFLFVIVHDAYYDGLFIYAQPNDEGRIIKKKNSDGAD
jgi:hypothetical protein